MKLVHDELRDAGELVAMGQEELAAKATQDVIPKLEVVPRRYAFRARTCCCERLRDAGRVVAAASAEGLLPEADEAFRRWLAEGEFFYAALALHSVVQQCREAAIVSRDARLSESLYRRAIAGLALEWDLLAGSSFKVRRKMQEQALHQQAFLAVRVGSETGSLALVERSIEEINSLDQQTDLGVRARLDTYRARITYHTYVGDFDRAEFFLKEQAEPLYKSVSPQSPYTELSLAIREIELRLGQGRFAIARELTKTFAKTWAAHPLAIYWRRLERAWERVGQQLRMSPPSATQRRGARTSFYYFEDFLAV